MRDKWPPTFLEAWWMKTLLIVISICVFPFALLGAAVSWLVDQLGFRHFLHPQRRSVNRVRYVLMLCLILAGIVAACTVAGLFFPTLVEPAKPNNLK